jgi:ABC-2 type transport system permease protein
MIRNRWSQVMLNEVRNRLRDHTLLIVAVVAPIIFATITSFAFASFNQSQPVHLAITDRSSDPGQDSLLRAIAADPQVRKVAVVDIVSSPSAARARIISGSADAGLILPAGASLGAGGIPQVAGAAEVLESQQKPIGAAVAEAVLQTIGGEEWLNHVVLASLSGTAADPSTTLHTFTPHNPITLTDVQASSRSLNAATYYGSSMAIVFLLFSVMPAAKSLWGERQNNTLQRLLSSGVSRWAIVAGKAVAAQVTGMLSMLSVWAVTVLAFHADWGSPGAVVLLITATVAAAVAISFAIASLVRTEESLDGLVAVATFVLVLIGGNFVPPADLPGGLRLAGLFTPNGWALRGFLDLATASGAIATIALPLFALLGFTAGIWLFTATRMRALVTP